MSKPEWPWMELRAVIAKAFAGVTANLSWNDELERRRHAKLKLLLRLVLAVGLSCLLLLSWLVVYLMMLPE